MSDGNRKEPIKGQPADPERFLRQLEEEAKTLPVDLDGKQKQQFLLYYNILLEWNRVMNLTAITEPEEVITKHFIDSLSLVRAIPELAESGMTAADLGTGAGFPGIPLKIAFPELKVTLMDSLGKRVKFLREVIAQLSLTGISAIHGRAEDIGKDPAHREQYDLCVSRAVANMAVLSEYCLPLVKVGGIFAAYKTGKAEDELQQAANAIRLLGGGTQKLVDLQLPNGDDRKLVIIHKEKTTPKKYPRKAGTPAKEPLH